MVTQVQERAPTVLSAAEPPAPSQPLTGPAVLGLLALAALGALLLSGPARSLTMLPALLLAPGLVVGRHLRLVETRNVPAALAMATAVSLAIEAFLALLGVWTGVWHPGLVAGVLAVACVIDVAAVDLRNPRVGVARVLGRLRALTVRGRGTDRLEVGVPVLVLGAAIALWGVSLGTIDVGHLGSYGLPPALNLEWYLAVALAVFGAVFLTWRAPLRPWLVSAYVVTVVVIVFATNPALSAVPQYAWSYKHIGVTRYLQVHGAVKAGGDIYQRWPAFFAVAAWTSSVTHTPVLELARWCELFFTLWGVAFVVALTSLFTRDRRVWATAALLFVVTNWVGQNYYAPQPFAYSLDLAVVYLVFRRGRRVRRGNWRRWERLQAFLSRSEGVTSLRRPLDWTSGTAALAALLVFVMTASHQLTPYLLVAQLGALAMLRLVRPWWIVVLVAATAVGYLLPNLAFIMHHYGLISGLNPIDNVTVTAGLAEHRAFIPSHIGGVLSYLVALLALISFVRLVRLGEYRTSVAAAGLAIAPFIILFGSNYGGEASLRIFLFSSPWRDIAIALALTTLRPRRRMLTSCAVVAAVTPLFLFAAFDTAATDIFPKDEVQASEFFYAHAPSGSELMLAGKDFPTWLGPRYTEMSGPLGDATPNLLAQHKFLRRLPTPSDLPTIVSVLRQDSRHPFLAFATTEELYARDFGPGSIQGMRELENAVASSRLFRIYLRTRDARIYELLPASS